MPIKSPSLLPLIAIKLWALLTAQCLLSVLNPKGLAMNESLTPRPIVVGIDGSKAESRAALWAVDEAVSRDVPVRLLYAIEPRDTVAADSEAAAREFAIAETAVHRALTAIEATGQPVKIETEIVQGPPIRSLIGASAFATMVCVGAVGLCNFRPVRIVFTAAVQDLSHSCP